MEPVHVVALQPASINESVRSKKHYDWYTNLRDQHHANHVELDAAFKRYGVNCLTEIGLHLEKTAELEHEFGNIKLKLDEGPDKYEPQFLLKMKGKKKELGSEIERRHNYEGCMVQQFNELKKLADSDVVSTYVVKDDFNWTDMMMEEQLCDFPENCLCDILLEPDLKLKAKWKRIKK